MQKKNVLSLLLALAFILSGFLAATQSITAESSTASLKGDFEVQIFEGGFGMEVWEKALDGFQKENPELNIIKNFGAQINTQLSSRWIADNPPDFVFLDGPDAPATQYFKDGKMLDLTDFFNNMISKDTGKPIKEKVLSNLIRPFSDGKIYKAPYLFNCWGMWYDEKLLEDNGIEVPKNYQELMDVSSKLKDKGIAGIVYTGVYPGYLLEGAINPAIISEGGQEAFDAMYTPDPEFFRGEVFKKVISKFENMVKNGYVLKISTALNHTGAQMEWLNRKAMMVPCGLWLEAEMKEDTPSDFKMRFLPTVLQDQNQKMSIIPSSIAVGVASKAKNPEAGLAFIEYLYRDEVIKSFVEATGTPSALHVDASSLNISDAAKDVIKWTSSPDVQFVSQLDNDIGVVTDVLGNGINALLLGNITTDQLCEKVAQAAEKYLEEHK